MRFNDKVRSFNPSAPMWQATFSRYTFYRRG